MTDNDVERYTTMKHTMSESTKLILKYVKLMLSRRLQINENNEKIKLLDDDEEFISEENGEYYSIRTNDVNPNLKIYYVKIMQNEYIKTTTMKLSKITSISSKPGKKIIICENYMSKVESQYANQNFEFFQYFYFLDDNFESIDRPKYKILTKKEQNDYFEDYMSQPEFSQNILSIDINVKYFALKPDEIVKIERLSPSSGKSFTYKLITEKPEK